MAIKDIRDNLRRIKDADPVELAGQVNNWLHESGEAIRLKIEDEVEKAVEKRGFVKKSEFSKLEARIAALEGKPVKNSREQSSVKRSPVKGVKEIKRGTKKVATRSASKVNKGRGK